MGLVAELPQGGRGGARVSAAYEEGLERARAGDVDGALALFRAAFRQEESGRVHAALGNCYFLQGDLENALENLKRACELEPESAEHRSDLAAVLAARGMHREAVHLYHDAMQADPARGEYPYRLGRLLQELGAVDEAVAAFRAAVERDPFQAEYREALGRALYRVGRPDEAADALRVAGRLGRDGSAFALGVAEFAAGRFAEAVDALADCGTAGAAELRGRALARLGQLAEAVEALGEACRLAPSDPSPLRRLGAAWMQLEQYERAARTFQKLTFLEPDCQQTWYNLGTAFLFAGMPDRAQEALERAPDVPLAAQNLAAARQALA